MALGKRQKIIPGPKHVSKTLNSMRMTTLRQSRLPHHPSQKVQNSSLGRIRYSGYKPSQQEAAHALESVDALEIALKKQNEQQLAAAGIV